LLHQLAHIDKTFKRALDQVFSTKFATLSFIKIRNGIYFKYNEKEIHKKSKQSAITFDSKILLL